MVWPLRRCSLRAKRGGFFEEFRPLMSGQLMKKSGKKIFLTIF
jgi:hypothetical protein